MEKKRILIPGGRLSDWALVNAAHRLGMYVITSGNRPDDPAHEFSDEYVCADYSDKEAMLKIAKEKKIDYMCSNSNDFGLLSTAYVCEKLGLPGHDSYETTKLLHTKDSFKKIAKKLNIHSPVSEIFDNREDAIAYLKNCKDKQIIKPTDNVGSNGVSTPNSADEIEEKVDFAFSKSKSGKILVEPFIEGFFAPVTSMIINKKVVAFFCDGAFKYPEGERIAPEFPISNRNNGYMNPCPYMDEFAPSIIEDFNKIAEELNLVDGKLHCELMITPNHEAYIFDIHRRMSGFAEPWPEWNRTIGFNWEDWIVKAECGMDLSDFPVGVKQNKYFHARDIYAPRNGIIDRVVLDEYLTKHIYPKYDGKEYCAYNLTVVDHLHSPVLKGCIDEFGNQTRGNTLSFAFDNEKECELLANPNNDEFYKHVKFEYR